MKKTVYYISLLFTIICMMMTVACSAQAVPDTSLNNVFPDSTKTEGKMGIKEDSINKQTLVAIPPADSTAKPKKYEPIPKKAGLYSGILPGLGQLYNKQYWKIPVIYAGLGVAAYFIADNLKNYQSYRKAYIGRFNNPYPTDPYANLYTQDQLQQLQDDYERYLDLTVLLTGLGYVLQVLDAVTSAHLKNFDISPDLSMKVQPVAFPNGAGLGLVFNFK